MCTKLLNRVFKKVVTQTLKAQNAENISKEEEEEGKEEEKAEGLPFYNMQAIFNSQLT